MCAVLTPLFTPGVHLPWPSLGWNIRTMFDKTESNRRERRSALIAHELSRVDVDFAALSDVRFPEEGSLQEQSAGYTLFWSGKPATERRLGGAGFMLRTSIASKLEGLPRVCQNAVTWKGILGRHGFRNCNDNGRLLLEFCTEQQLVITNTIFQQKNSLKTTWMHPRSKHWHIIEYVLARQRDLKDILHTRVMPSAECHTDHRLVRCKLTLHFKLKPRKGGPPRKSSSSASYSQLK